MSDATYRPGSFVWYELMTVDPAASRRFYEALMPGWSIETTPIGDMDYPLISADGTGIGGILEMPAEAKGAQTFWLGYVSVPDVDEAAAAVREGGGRVLMGPQTMDPVGRMVVFADPEGAVIAAFKSSSGDGPAPERPPVGHVCWAELATTDADRSLGFYERVFGWTRGRFEGHRVLEREGGEPVCSVDAAAPGQPQAWLFHLLVEDLEASTRKAAELGARIVMGPEEVPGIGRFTIIQDPQDAVVVLFQE